VCCWWRMSSIPTSGTSARLPLNCLHTHKQRSERAHAPLKVGTHKRHLPVCSSTARASHKRCQQCAHRRLSRTSSATPTDSFLSSVTRVLTRFVLALIIALVVDPCLTVCGRKIAQTALIAMTHRPPPPCTHHHNFHLRCRRRHCSRCHHHCFRKQHHHPPPLATTCHLQH
jgi:hypothetical protein